MKPAPFKYARPATLAEAYALLAQGGDAAKVLAGGQSLVPTLNMRLSQPAALIDINAIPGLSGIAVANGTVRIGALTRHAEIERSQVVAQHLPLVHAAMPQIAHVAIRNRGTIGGSLALADPAAELPACCLALGATLVLGSPGGERRVTATDFFRALYETALAPGELVLAVEFPALAAGYRSSFLELTRRHGDYAIVGVAIHAKAGADRTTDARIAFFGIGSTAVLARGAAAALDGKPLAETAITAAKAALDRDLDPLADLYHTAETKLHLAKVVLGRALAALAA